MAKTTSAAITIRKNISSLPGQRDRHQHYRRIHFDGKTVKGCELLFLLLCVHVRRI